MKSLKSNTIDSIVTDPPYGIGMANWDKELPEKKIWEECLRVLKSGGHILSFASSRRYHHLAQKMESAGFDTFNMLTWIHEGGMPKGKNLSKVFDFESQIPKPDDRFRFYLKSEIKRSGLKVKEIEELSGTRGYFCRFIGNHRPVYPSLETWKKIKRVLGLDDTFDHLMKDLDLKRKEFWKNKSQKNKGQFLSDFSKELKSYDPSSEQSKEWKGWRYGKQTLRPMLEPIYLGQKPPLRPLSKNIKKYGVGALNVGETKQIGTDGKERFLPDLLVQGELGIDLPIGAPKFFYDKKLGKTERIDNPHPTAKPLSLINTLVKLVTPPGGMCLDPFMGGGTTGVACLHQGLDFIGIERDKKIFNTAKERIMTHRVNNQKKN